MTRASCRYCGARLTYHPRLFVWRHETVPKFEHAPVPRPDTIEAVIPPNPRTPLEASR